jgi:hypothetical protein
MAPSAVGVCKLKGLPHAPCEGQNLSLAQAVHEAGEAGSSDLRNLLDDEQPAACPEMHTIHFAIRSTKRGLWLGP